MNYADYLPHIHTDERPEGFPVRRVPGHRNWVPVGLGALNDSAMQPGETPEQYKRRRLNEIRVTDGAAANPFSSVPVTPLLLVAAVAVLFLSQRY